MEHKIFPAILTKVVDPDQGIVEHIVAVMGNVDLGGDVIHPGAFTKTISERGLRVKCLDQHQTNSVLNVLGKPLAMKEIGRGEMPADLLKDYPDVTGSLWVQTKYNLKTEAGHDAFQHIAAGDVDQYSIGYDTLDSDYSKIKIDGATKTVRNLRTIKLYEYSPVVFGMNTATATISAKENVPVSPDAIAPAKEMTAESETEMKPIRRFGDVLSASLHQMFTFQCDELVMRGMIDVEQRKLLSSLIGDALDILTQGIPAEIATIDLDACNSDPQMATMSIAKAGRVQAGRNMARLNRIMEELRALMEDAGMMDEESGKTATSESTDTTKQAGSVIPPTDDDLMSQIMVGQIEIELQKLKEV